MKKILKNQRQLNSFYKSTYDEKLHNAAILLLVLLFSFSLILLASFCHAQELLYKSDGLVSENQNPKPVEILDKEQFTRIIDLNGVVGIDGSLRVLESTFVKRFDLVEISTPVTPAVNHAIIFLTPGSGSKQQISILWDDGTLSRLAGN